MIEGRALTRADVPEIWRIDRSERIERIYRFVDGALVLEPHHFDATGLATRRSREVHAHPRGLRGSRRLAVRPVRRRQADRRGRAGEPLHREARRPAPGRVPARRKRLPRSRLRQAAVRTRGQRRTRARCEESCTSRRRNRSTRSTSTWGSAARSRPSRIRTCSRWSRRTSISNSISGARAFEPPHRGIVRQHRLVMGGRR